MTDSTNESAVDVEPDPRGVVLPVRAQAGSRRNAIVGVRSGMLRVAVTAAPEKGKANKAIAEVLSKALGVSKSAVVLLSGETSSRKRFLIVGEKLESLLSNLARIAGN